ncbi:Phosphatidylcholine:ceramide cholinephosphotransferase 3 [Trichostrongylus colubriformis]|uniref:Phosphatidylcholine:ceramide cholinephosphotransferase 3 n=1 Tax=Trichostrongylus colubriformis TaxID=6319 RepID=A0AAN8IYV4_TRICO
MEDDHETFRRLLLAPIYIPFLRTHSHTVLTRRNIVSNTLTMSKYQITKWLFLFDYCLIAALCNYAVLAYTHDFSLRQPLPDILFSLFPEQEWASHFGDYMTFATLTSLCVLLIFHQSRAIVARRFLFIFATIYGLRSVTLLITQLPPGYENNTMRCREQVNITFKLFLSRIVEQAVRAGFQGKSNLICGDMLFSGHTLTMVTCALCVAYYLPARWRMFQWIPILFTAIGMACMIISRDHYTIDIFIAYWLSSFIFRTYHAFCEVNIPVERRKSVLYGLWMLWIVEWLEDDIVPGRVENEFEPPVDALFRLLGDQAIRRQEKSRIPHERFK